MNKTAFITGITGQDGSYLAELLLDRGYRVTGLIRRSSQGENLQNIAGIVDEIELINGDMTDSASIQNAIRKVRPDEVYNLAAQSFVPQSWASPAYTMEVNALGALHVFEACRNLDKDIRIYQASTSEMYGNVLTEIDFDYGEDADRLVLHEQSKMNPRSPYGSSKLAAHSLAKVYRESYGMHISAGILFNHESPRRGEIFVTRKIAKHVAEIHAGRRDKIKLGSLHSRRDWGFAGDYVFAMWLMLQRSEPADYVIGTGVTRSVKGFLETAWRVAGQLMELDLDLDEHFEHDPKFMRPADITVLIADASKARNELGWMPMVGFDELVEMMVRAEIAKLQSGI